jgi:hypothetical protein
VLHLPFSGGPLGPTPLWRAEAPLLRLAGVRTVIIPYGADVYRLSQIDDARLRGAFADAYPQTRQHEQSIQERIDFWSRHADLILVGFTVEGLPRIDACLGNFVCIDLTEWQARDAYSDADGRSGPVVVLHMANHPRLKGTKDIVAAVDTLRQDGLDVDLRLLTGVPNAEVRRALSEADVLADQLLLPGYGLAAIEGMASGVPVLANVDGSEVAAYLREHSFLAECPIVQATPETVRAVLRTLVTDPELRRRLGRSGRAYAENYHSYAAAQYLFGAVRGRLLDGRPVDLEALFDPERSSHDRPRALVEPPFAGRLGG